MHGEPRPSTRRVNHEAAASSESSGSGHSAAFGNLSFAQQEKISDFGLGVQLDSVESTDYPRAMGLAWTNRLAFAVPWMPVLRGVPEQNSESVELVLIFASPWEEYSDLVVIQNPCPVAHFPKTCGH